MALGLSLASLFSIKMARGEVRMHRVGKIKEYQQKASPLPTLSPGGRPDGQGKTETVGLERERWMAKILGREAR